MRSGGTLGMGLGNIYEQLHSRYLNVASLASQMRSIGRAQYFIVSAMQCNISHKAMFTGRVKYWEEGADRQHCDGVFGGLRLRRKLLRRKELSYDLAV